MKAEAKIITEIFNSTYQVEVPFFQRPYVWGEALWQRLLEDVEYLVESSDSNSTDPNRTHFIGSIILKDDGEVKRGNYSIKRKILVDGQQRVTTLLILLKVIALKASLGDKFIELFCRDADDYLFTQGKNDNDAFELVMGHSVAEEIVNSEYKSQIIPAFNYFVKAVGDKLKFNDFFKYKRLIERINFVCIELEEKENEQQIFNSLNSLGVNLTTSELLKNYLFSQDTIDQYQAKWVKVFEKDDDTRDYWFQEVDRGSVKSAMIDIFFESYFKLFVQGDQYNISTDEKKRYDRTDNLFLSIQDFIAKHCNKDKSIFIDSIKDYAEAFRQYFKPSLCNESISGDSALERLNIVMFGLGNTTLIPYVLYVAKNVADPMEQNKIYHALESFIMRRIVTKEPTNVYTKLINSLINKQTRTVGDLISRLRNEEIDANKDMIPSDDQLVSGIRERVRTNSQSKGILYLIESSLQDDDKVATLLRGFNDYSVEHLMPKKWENNWPSCPADEVDKRNRALLTLGNLAIIPKKLNSSIRDANWETKKAGRGRSKGLIKYAAGLFTLADPLTKDEWNEEEIAKRSDWLCEHAKEIWKI